MGRLAVFVERYTISRSWELEALLRFKSAAEERGHELHFLFRPELRKIPRFDAVLIRALTDPLNSSFVAARMAELHGLPVIDDSQSIMICCDKIFMYRRLLQAHVPMPRTVMLDGDDIIPSRAEQLFAEMGPELVLKAPSSSFSSHVDKVRTPDDFVKVGQRYLHRAERIVVQEFVPSTFDWRVGVLAGEPLYVCRYVIPDETFKIQTVINGHLTTARVDSLPLHEAPPKVVETAVDAARAIGHGLYGVDLKETDRGVVTIEVNDNPTINAEEEDRYAPDIYRRIICHLLEGNQWGRH
ncbi:MAG: ATP-grasp domain-containing protein [candidate division Zixibacteria bacterium]|nr:ATP-grasp domain-containing protein [candidate division Zixibacteria bacterium]